MGDSNVLWETIGQKIFITVPKVTMKSLLSQKQSEMQYLSGMMFSPVQTPLTGPRCSSSAPLKGDQPWGKCYQEGRELCNLWLFPSQSEKSPTRAASVTENEKARRNDWSHKVRLYNFPKYFRLSKIALRKLHLFLSTYACENRFSTITDKD